MPDHILREGSPRHLSLKKLLVTSTLFLTVKNLDRFMILDDIAMKNTSNRHGGFVESQRIIFLLIFMLSGISNTILKIVCREI